MCTITFTAITEYDPEVKVYVGIIPGIPGAHSQGDTLDELQRNLQEALELCFEVRSGSPTKVCVLIQRSI